MVIRPHSTTFLSTLSLRRATYLINTYHRIFGEDFYPRSPCGERRFVRCRFWVLSNISIHALLAESDAVPLESYFLHSLFLSTLSLRRATSSLRINFTTSPNFYPRSPCGERPVLFLFAFSHKKFLSTLSLRRATKNSNTHESTSLHFYPRSPCGERLIGQANRSTTIPFLSTLSLRRATLNRTPPLTSRTDFYPRSPCGERRPAFRGPLILSEFLSTLSLRRATTFAVTETIEVEFLSTLSLRRATPPG